MINKIVQEYRKYNVEFNPSDKEFVFRKPIPVLELIIFRYLLNKYRIEYNDIKVVEKQRKNPYGSYWI